MRSMYTRFGGCRCVCVAAATFIIHLHVHVQCSHKCFFTHVPSTAATTHTHTRTVHTGMENMHADGMIPWCMYSAHSHSVSYFGVYIFPLFLFSERLARGALLFVFRSFFLVFAPFLFAWFFSFAATTAESTAMMLPSVCVCVCCLRSAASVCWWKDFFRLFIPIFSRVERNQKKHTHTHKHARRSYDVKSEYIFFVHHGIYIFLFRRSH